MYKLSDAQIDFILSDIGARGVETEDLQYNLLDHICCIIEREFEGKGDFEPFYRQVVSRFFNKELRELEEETQLLLTFKYYYTMKKFMFISGFISAFLMLFGAYFKIMHWPGANVMLVLGMLTLAIVFLPLMFTLRLREKTEKRDKAVLILGLFSAIYFLIGALFKFMHWPGAGIFVLTGIPFLLFVFLPVYIVNGIKNPAAKVNTIVTAILIIAGSGFVMVLPSKSNVYSIPSKLNNLKNEEMVLAQMQELADDSLRTDLKQAYEDFMKSAKDFKNLITELSSQVEYDTYIEDLASNSTEASYGTRLREYPELNKFISAVINFEARSQTKIYNYEDYMAYNAPDRKSQIDYALVSHPNVKDLLGTIILTQQEATLALAKR